MPAPEDFSRVADLLGDFYDKATSPASPADDPARAQGSRGSGSPGSRTPGASSSRAKNGDAARVSRLLAQVWPEIAGAEVAANATPVQLRAGRLVVSTESSVWAHTLQYLSEDLVARLNERLGPGTIRQIVFRHAGWEERASCAPVADAAPQANASRPAVPLTSEQSEALAAVGDLDLPPAMREKIQAAMKAAFVRAQQDAVR